MKGMKQRMKYKVGHDAELRLQSKIAEYFKKTCSTEECYGNWNILHTPNGPCGDLLLRIGTVHYILECKTILSYYSNHRRGYCKVPVAQIHCMEEKRKKGFIPFLAVELRAKGHSVWFVVDWGMVRKKWMQSKPNHMSLTFWWILENGIKLDSWLYWVI